MTDAEPGPAVSPDARPAAGPDAGPESEIRRESDTPATESPNAGASPRSGGTQEQERTPGPRVEAAPADLAATPDATPLPGAHRGGFSRALTGPVALTIESAPVEPGTEDADYTPAEWVTPPPGIRFASWALGFAIVGLLVSLVVGWGFLLGIVAIVAGVMALRRRESRALAVWAIALAAVSIVYSIGWLVWAASQGALAMG
jgi:hypothetical protein